MALRSSPACSRKIFAASIGSPTRTQMELRTVGVVSMTVVVVFVADAVAIYRKKALPVPIPLAFAACMVALVIASPQLAAMAQHIFANNLHDQTFINKFCQGMDEGTMPGWAKGKENFKDYIFGKYD